jgi:Glycosyl hydrolase family 30 beta sandwich domain
MNSKVKLLLIAIALVSVITALWLISFPQQGFITINSKKTYQTMTGWEATAGIGQIDFPPEQYQRWSDTVATMAADLGINRLRVEIPSGTENSRDWYGESLAGTIPRGEWGKHRYEIINDNADPNVINPNGFKWTKFDQAMDTVVLPLRKKLAARGEQLYLNVNYVDFDLSAFEHKSHPSEYAEFVLATYQHMQTKYGFVPDAWEVILEPDNSTGWTATEVGQVIAAAGSRLTAAGFTPRFIAPSTASAFETYFWFNTILMVPGAQQYLKEVAYHRYQNISNEDLTKSRARVRQFGMDSSMLEWIGATYSTLHDDLKVGENSAWQQYTLAYPTEDNGAQYFVVSNPTSPHPIVAIGSRTRFFQQYFKYVRAGAVRIDAQTSNSNFDPVAFRNTNGKQVVVVKASSAGSFNIQGLSAGTYGIKYTTSAEFDVSVPQVSIGAGQMVSASIPAAGVITVYGTYPANPTPSPTPKSKNAD